MVVFDLGGVLAPTGRSLTALADALEVPENDLAGPYWAYRDAYDLGAGAAEYWYRVTAALGRSPDAGLVGRLDEIDVECWTEIAADAAALLADLAARGIPLGVLSNAPASLARAVRAAAWSPLFRTLVFSSDLGMMKPDPLIYRAADAELGVSPSDVVFFDDRPVNVEAAREHGWRAHVWTGCEQARAVLAGETVLASLASEDGVDG